MNFLPKRRQILVGAATGVLCRPFVRVARGQAAQVKRGAFFVAFYYPHNMSGQWWPKGTATDFTLGAALPALEPLRQHITFFQNVVAKSAHRGWENHGGAYHVLTGHADKKDALGPSLDQVMADHWMKEQPTPVHSLNVWAAPPMPNTTSCSYRGPKQPVRPEANPQVAFMNVFANPTSKISPEDLRRTEARRRSLLDNLRSELGVLKNGLGKEDGVLLDGHLASLRDLETSLFATRGTGEAPMCADAKGRPLAGGDFPKTLKAQMDVTVAAIACGLTRAAVIQGGDGHNNFLTFPWLGVNVTHHLGIQHGEGGVAGGHLKVTSWFVEQFAYLIKRFADIPSAGGSLINEGLLMHTTSMGWGHTAAGLPYLVAGHGGGAIKGGRLVTSGTNKSDGADLNQGLHAADILLTCANVLGATHLKHFGDPMYSQGPVAGMLT